MKSSASPTLASLFPNASASTVAANPHLVAPNGGSGKQNDVQAVMKPRRGRMNNTEIAYSLILRGMFERGEILRYEYEGITLRWADMRYCPDFFVTVRHCSSMPGCHQFRCIEVKGSHIHYEQQAIARFKGCRSYWPEFEFELWQKTKNGWVRKF